MASLESGDTLFLYTDGVTEMTDPKGHRFSEGRLVELLDGATVEVQTLINNVLRIECQGIATGAGACWSTCRPGCFGTLPKSREVELGTPD